MRRILAALIALTVAASPVSAYVGETSVTNPYEESTAGGDVQSVQADAQAAESEIQRMTDLYSLSGSAPATAMEDTAEGTVDATALPPPEPLSVPPSTEADIVSDSDDPTAIQPEPVPADPNETVLTQDSTADPEGAAPPPDPAPQTEEPTSADADPELVIPPPPLTQELRDLEQATDPLLRNDAALRLRNALEREYANNGAFMRRYVVETRLFENMADLFFREHDFASGDPGPASGLLAEILLVIVRNQPDRAWPQIQASRFFPRYRDLIERYNGQRPLLLYVARNGPADYMAGKSDYPDILADIQGGLFPGLADGVMTGLAAQVDPSPRDRLSNSPMFLYVYGGYALNSLVQEFAVQGGTDEALAEIRNSGLLFSFFRYATMPSPWNGHVGLSADMYDTFTTVIGRDPSAAAAVLDRLDPDLGQTPRQFIIENFTRDMDAVTPFLRLTTRKRIGTYNAAGSRLGNLIPATPTGLGGEPVATDAPDATSGGETTSPPPVYTDASSEPSGGTLPTTVDWSAEISSLWAELGMEQSEYTMESGDLQTDDAELDGFETEEISDGNEFIADEQETGGSAEIPVQAGESTAQVGAASVADYAGFPVSTLSAPMDPPPGGVPDAPPAPQPFTPPAIPQDRYDRMRDFASRLATVGAAGMDALQEEIRTAVGEPAPPALPTDAAINAIANQADADTIGRQLRDYQNHIYAVLGIPVEVNPGDIRDILESRFRVQETNLYIAQGLLDQNAKSTETMGYLVDMRLTSMRISTLLAQQDLYLSQARLGIAAAELAIAAGQDPAPFIAQARDANASFAAASTAIRTARTLRDLQEAQYRRASLELEAVRARVLTAMRFRAFAAASMAVIQARYDYLWGKWNGKIVDYRIKVGNMGLDELPPPVWV